MKTIFGIFILFLFSQEGIAQSCTALGQNSGTAFPVCGTSVFDQKTVPICGDRSIPVNCHDGANYQDKNPFWYKFTCFKGGTLGLTITPNTLSDDYDWQLFDITDHKPEDVYSDATLFVVGNWSHRSGKTGTSPDYSSALECSGNAYPQFSMMPVLKEGHHYLLLVSHFTDSQSGYGLSFGGGTAVITDTTKPRLKKAAASCDGSKITIQLNKKMKCSSLVPDGSDFVITAGAAKVVAAASTDCNNGFDMDSLTLTLDRFLPPGNYTVSIKNGTDKNTLLDNCGAGIPEGDKLTFTVEKVAPTPMDSIPAVGCAPLRIRVVFDGPMRCKSIATDGSDFSITGPSQVMVTGAKGVDCQNGLSDTIELNLSKPIVVGGQYTLSLRQGSDGNSLLSECAQETPARSSLTFETKDTVSAAFKHQVTYTCNHTTIQLQNNGGNGINRWNWTLGNGEAATISNPVYVDTTFDDQQIRLMVSNGICSDSASVTLLLNKTYKVKANFEAPEFVCPNDEAIFVNHSVGDIVSRQWSFGNGNTSFLETPPRQQYPVATRTQMLAVKLTVKNTIGCKDTAVRQLKVINNCFIAVPTAFTPNGDGMNDYLYPLNAYKAKDLDFRVYNRYGQKVFETRDWTQKWDGTFNNEKQPLGSYVWMLTYTNTDTGEKVFKKGATLLIR